MSDDKPAQIGVPDLLQLLFIGLKLGGAIAWSWWVVFIPLWISIGLGVLLLLLRSPK